MEELKPGCERPAVGIISEESKEEVFSEEIKTKEEVTSMIKVGKKAPDFVAPAYFNGKFINVKLSDYVGKWVVLCFYPGDFTFV